MYCDTIPYELGIRLKEKGMPIDAEGKMLYCPPYAQVFDWFAKKGLIIVIMPCWDCSNEQITFEWESVISKVGTPSSQTNAITAYHNTWNNAADAAIEKALELIKEESK